jgi:hypothetical protein
VRKHKHRVFLHHRTCFKPSFFGLIDRQSLSHVTTSYNAGRWRKYEFWDYFKCLSGVLGVIVTTKSTQVWTSHFSTGDLKMFLWSFFCPRFEVYMGHNCDTPVCTWYTSDEDKDIVVISTGHARRSRTLDYRPRLGQTVHIQNQFSDRLCNNIRTDKGWDWWRPPRVLRRAVPSPLHTWT